MTEMQLIFIAVCSGALIGFDYYHTKNSKKAVLIAFLASTAFYIWILIVKSINL